MGIGTRLIACPSCSCHAFARETVCPNCGATLRTSDGSLPRTAGAMMLGLTIVTVSNNACVLVPDTRNWGGNGGVGGMGGTSGSMEGSTVISAYGIASTSSSPQGGMGGMGGMGACEMTCADAITNGTTVCGSASANSQKFYNDFRECACERGAADPVAGCKDVCSDNYCMSVDPSSDCGQCIQIGACQAEFSSCASDI